MGDDLITITFGLPGPIQNELVSLHNLLSKTYKTNFISEFQSYRPHVTIYQAKFPTKNREEVLRIIDSIATNSKGVLFTPIGVDTKGKYVAFRFEKNEEIEGLHQEIVGKLNSLREGKIKSSYEDPGQMYSDKEKNQIKDFGYPYVMELYNPHLTIIALENDSDAPNVAKSLSWNKKFLGHCITVIISHEDDQGVRTKTMHDFLFENSKS